MSKRDISHYDPIEININELKKILTDFEGLVENRIINHHEANNLFYELEYEVKANLTEVFGHERSTAEKGLTNSIITYEMPYRDAVLFAYWSHKGVPVETTEQEIKAGYFRSNLFYKGHRWSDKEKRELFYRFFDTIKWASEGDGPVDFFTRYAIENNLRYLKISGTDESNKYQNTQESTLTIPTKQDLIKLQAPALISLIEFIDSMRQINKDKTEVDIFERQNKMTLSNLKDLYTNAFHELENGNRDFLLNLQKSILDIFGIKDSLKNASLSGLNPKRIFNVIVAFQYYDYPFDIHFFLPKSPNQHKHLISSLIITTKHGQYLDNNFKKAMCEYADTLSKISLIEQKIWEKQGQNLSLYWMWRKRFEEREENFERMTNVSYNICKAICKNEDIQTHHIPYNVKQFDSFFDKIVSRANNRTNELSIDKKKEYETRVLTPTRKNADWIFNDLNDIARLRIICVYKNDIDRIVDCFKQLKEDIKLLEIKDLREMPGYKSIHLVFKLGEKRKHIYEFRDLMDLKCELQIRTLLNQGWADVSHSLSYKPHFPENFKKILNNKLKMEKKLKIKSELLDEIDQEFAELRINIENYKDRL